MAWKLLASVVLLSSLSASAVSDPDCPTEAEPTVADQLAQHVKGCPNNEGMETICGHINLMSLDEDYQNKYRFQTLLKRAACVSPTDSPAQEKTKIAAYWDKYGQYLTCNNPHFSIPNGSVVKFAIQKQFDNFIVDLSHRWKVNLNRIDPADGRTVLDFAYDELAIEKAKGSSLANKIQTYITVLKNNGAKRRDEL